MAGFNSMSSYAQGTSDGHYDATATDVADFFACGMT